MKEPAMNKAMTIASNRAKPIHEITRRIKNKFLGDVQRRNRNEQLRVILYSHDTMGVGHMRRNLLIASQITRTFPQSSVLVIAGAKEANTFAQQAGIDCLTLPAFQKKSNGTYTTRNLGLSASDVLKVRSDTILAAIKSFRPDILIVDKVPAGAGGELLPSLRWISESTTCQCVLGLRDILDDPQSAKREWSESGSNQVLREHFDSIWIYGDPHVYDAIQEYEFPDDIADMSTYTGYLNTESRLKNLGRLPYEIEIPYVLCTVGGGQDGEHLATTFVEAMRVAPRNSVLLTGPYMPPSTAERIQKQADGISQLKVVEFVDEGDLLVRNASHVVSMGGYNTIAAILSHQKTALIVPRCVLRQEQLIRARQLSNLGLVDVQVSTQLTPASINRWLQTSQPPCYSKANLNMRGLSRISQIIEMQLQSTPELTCATQEADTNGN